MFKTIIILCTFFLFLPNVEANCISLPCELVTLNISNCSYEVLNNHAAVERMIKQSVDFHGSKDDYLRSFSGVRLLSSNTKNMETVCSEKELQIPKKIKNIKSSPASEYFYQTKDPKWCERFVGKRVTLFFTPDCCDTGTPMSASCIAKIPALEDIPKYLKIQKKK